MGRKFLWKNCSRETVTYKTGRAAGGCISAAEVCHTGSWQQCEMDEQNFCA